MVVLVGVSLGALHGHCRSRSPSRSSWRSSSPRTGRRSGRTPSPAAPTSSRRRTSASCRRLVAAAALLVDYVLTVAVSVASGSLRHHLCGLVPRAVPRRAVTRGDRADRVRQPQGRSRGGLPVRDPDLWLHRRALHHDRNGHHALRDRDVPARDRSEPACGRGRSGRTARDPARVLVGRLGVDRRRGDRQRRQCVQAAPVGERGAHPRGARHDRDQPLPRCLVARGPHARAAEHDRLGALADRTRSLPSRVGAASFMYWVVQVFTFAILVLAANTSYQGFPRLVGAAREGRLRRAAVHEPRRPARLLERGRRAHRCGDGR